MLVYCVMSIRREAEIARFTHAACSSVRCVEKKYTNEFGKLTDKSEFIMTKTPTPGYSDELRLEAVKYVTEQEAGLSETQPRLSNTNITYLGQKG